MASVIASIGALPVVSQLVAGATTAVAALGSVQILTDKITTALGGSITYLTRHAVPVGGIIAAERNQSSLASLVCVAYAAQTVGNDFFAQQQTVCAPSFTCSYLPGASWFANCNASWNCTYVTAEYYFAGAIAMACLAKAAQVAIRMANRAP